MIAKVGKYIPQRDKELKENIQIKEN